MFWFFLLASFTKLNAQEALIEKSISTYQVDVNVGYRHFIFFGGFRVRFYITAFDDFVLSIGFSVGVDDIALRIFVSVNLSRGMAESCKQ